MELYQAKVYSANKSYARFVEIRITQTKIFHGLSGSNLCKLLCARPQPTCSCGQGEQFMECTLNIHIRIPPPL